MLECWHKRADGNTHLLGGVGDGEERRLFRDAPVSLSAAPERAPFRKDVQYVRQRPAYLEAARRGDFVLAHDAKNRPRQFDDLLAALAAFCHRHEITRASERNTDDVLPEGSRSDT